MTNETSAAGIVLTASDVAVALTRTAGAAAAEVIEVAAKVAANKLLADQLNSELETATHAATVTKSAADAAEALLKTAAAEAMLVTRKASDAAQAVVDVAAGTTAIAPLVAMFESVKGDILNVANQMDRQSEKQERDHETLLDVKAIGVKTYEQAQKTNGRMNNAEAWQTAHDTRASKKANIQEGKGQVVGIDATVVNKATSFLHDQLPWIISVFAVGSTFVMFMREIIWG